MFVAAIPGRANKIAAWIFLRGIPGNISSSGAIKRKTTATTTKTNIPKIFKRNPPRQMPCKDFSFLYLAVKLTHPFWRASDEIPCPIERKF